MAIVAIPSKDLDALQAKAGRVDRAKALATAKAKELVDVTAAVGAAGAMGVIRGLLEKDGKEFVIPGTPVDIEMVAGVALTTLGMTKYGGKHRGLLRSAGGGMLAHYAGQIARNSTKTGSFSLVGAEGVVGALHSPHEYNTQLGSPFADPAAKSLAESGI